MIERATTGTIVQQRGEIIRNAFEKICSGFLLSALNFARGSIVAC